MIETPTPDERIQIAYCPGCERASLTGDCGNDDHGRLQCPRCGTRLPADAFHDYIQDAVATYE